MHVNALEISDYDPVLTVGSSSETVTVSTLPPQLETLNAVLGATMEQEMYSALPIEMDAYGQADQRRATDYAFLMPGVQGNNTTGNPTTNTGIVNGSGSRARFPMYTSTVFRLCVQAATATRATCGRRSRWTQWTSSRCRPAAIPPSTRGRAFRITQLSRAATPITARYTSSSATHLWIHGGSLGR